MPMRSQRSSTWNGFVLRRTCRMSLCTILRMLFNVTCPLLAPTNRPSRMDGLSGCLMWTVCPRRSSSSGTAVLGQLFVVDFMWSRVDFTSRAKCDAAASQIRTLPTRCLWQAIFCRRNASRCLAQTRLCLRAARPCLREASRRNPCWRQASDSPRASRKYVVQT